MRDRIEILRRLYRNRVAARTPDLKVEFPHQYLYLRSELEREGIVVIKGFWKEALVEEVRASMEAVLDAFEQEYWREVAEECKDLKRGWGEFIPPSNIKLWCDEHMSDQRIFYAENVNESIRSFGSDMDFQRMAQYVTQKKSELKTTLFNRTRFVTGNKGSGGGWHRDGIYGHGFKTLLYLTDVHEDNGPFEYIPRSFHWSHHLRYAKRVDQYQYSSEEIEELLLKTTSVKVKTVTAEKGDLVIFNTNGIHRGRPIEKGVRCAITNYFT